MKKIVNDSSIKFYDNDKKIIQMGIIGADFYIELFNDDVVIIDKDSDLYNGLIYIFQQEYEFDNLFIGDKKTNNSLIWHSDQYFNPDDKMSIDSLSVLHVNCENDVFKIFATREIDKDMKLKNPYIIAFSPNFNGRYVVNKVTGMALQDDIMLNLYINLLKKEEIKVKKKVIY